MTMTVEALQARRAARGMSDPLNVLRAYGDAHASEAVTAVEECTPEQGAQWQERYTTGYQHGRSDTLNRDVRGDVLVTIPDEIPGETGARYVARHLDLAYRIGYTRAFAFYRSA